MFWLLVHWISLSEQRIYPKLMPIEDEESSNGKDSFTSEKNKLYWYCKCTVENRIIWCLHQLDWLVLQLSIASWFNIVFFGSFSFPVRRDSSNNVTRIVHSK